MDNKKLKELFNEIESEKDFGAIKDILYVLVNAVNDYQTIKGDKGPKGDTGEAGKSIIGPKGDKGDTTIVEKTIETIIEKQPIVTNEIKEVAVADTPEVIKEKLESLEDEDKLKISAIKNLEEELDKLKKQKQQPIYVGGSSGGGRIVKAIDISSSLNGSTKTFNIQAVWRIVSVHLSSFPNILRETTDFTWTPTSITFTSEIDAPSSLATGQTCILIIAE